MPTEQTCQKRMEVVKFDSQGEAEKMEVGVTELSA